MAHDDALEWRIVPSPSIPRGRWPALFGVTCRSTSSCVPWVPHLMVWRSRIRRFRRGTATPGVSLGYRALDPQKRSLEWLAARQIHASRQVASLILRSSLHRAELPPLTIRRRRGCSSDRVGDSASLQSPPGREEHESLGVLRRGSRSPVPGDLARMARMEHRDPVIWRVWRVCPDH
jgi:hypothetical protein